MSWTDERVEILKKMWGEGQSASVIAKELGGVTRNAVIGKVHRLGLSNRTTGGAKTAAKDKPAPKAAAAPSQSPRQSRNPRPRKKRPRLPRSRTRRGEARRARAQGNHSRRPAVAAAALRQ